MELFFVIASAFVSAETGEEAGAGTSPACLVWIEPAARKVFLDSSPVGRREIDLAAARGEWESAQVVLRSRSDREVRLEVSDLKGPEGSRVSSGAVEVRRIAYVPVPYAGKAYPDPLIPLKGALALKKDENVPVLITVKVPDINKNLSGDGSLLYPGRLPSGERVSEGPVASLRLLLLRDGFEDLEYLALFQKRFGRAQAEEAVGRLTDDLTHFSKDPLKLERARREIGKALSVIPEPAPRPASPDRNPGGAGR